MQDTSKLLYFSCPFVKSHSKPAQFVPLAYDLVVRLWPKSISLKTLTSFHSCYLFNDYLGKTSLCQKV